MQAVLQHMIFETYFNPDKHSLSQPSTGDTKLTDTQSENDMQRTSGIVLHAPLLYDLTVWLAMRGSERAFRERVLELACVNKGETVLDVGCGTGTLAIAAKRRVGENGAVYGVDASAEMIARAEKKAKKARADVSFNNGLAERLPFSTAQFDIVLSTVMLHHLPAKTRLLCAQEIRRVLKPGGRVLAVDFEGMSQQKRTFLSHFHRPHGHVRAQDIVALLYQAGFNTVESGPVGIRDLHFVLAQSSTSRDCCGGDHHEA